jgi:hypothetical protein
MDYLWKDIDESDEDLYPSPCVGCHREDSEECQIISERCRSYGEWRDEIYELENAPRALGNGHGNNFVSTKRFNK